MKEVWVKKTVWRRYLVEDESVDDVRQLLKKDPIGVEIIEDFYDKGRVVEYDNEEVVFPLEFEVKDE